MKDMFEKHLNTMPPVEKRKKSFFFRGLSSILKMSAENDFHWILYATYRAAFLVSCLFAMIVMIRLYPDAQNLTEERVVQELRFFTVGMSFPILLGIIPYYYHKVKRVIGFSRIDFMEVFPRRVARLNLNNDKYLKKLKIALIILVFCLPFGWMGIVIILNHYNLINSLLTVFFALTFYSMTVGSFFTAVLVHALMVYQQYKNHFHEIPSQNQNLSKE